MESPKKVSLVLGQLSFIDWSEIHTPSTWQLHLHHFIMWLLQLLCWVGGIKLLEVERGWSTTCGRYSWAKADITFTHTLLAGNSPVTCPHLTAKDTGKYSLAVWPEGRGNGFHDTWPGPATGINRNRELGPLSYGTGHPVKKADPKTQKQFHNCSL